jgi:membrane protease YdiL (CAAX protease family)
MPEELTRRRPVAGGATDVRRELDVRSDIGPGSTDPPAPVAPGEPAAPEDASARKRRSLVLTATAYVIAVALCEQVVSRVDVNWGVVGYAALLLWAIINASRAAWSGAATGASPAALRQHEQRWYTALALVPLLRLVSLAMPVAGLPMAIRDGLIVVPVLAAAALAMRASGYRRAEVGLSVRWSWHGLPLDVAVGGAGIGVAYLESRVRMPAPLFGSLAPGRDTAAIVALLMMMAFAEEFVFRGLIQHATWDLIGTPLAVILGALLFAALGSGNGSPVADALRLVTALVFGGVVATTRSLLGVSLSRGLFYVCLFIVFPLRQ